MPLTASYDKRLTALQTESTQSFFVGKNVIWKGKISSIGDTSDGCILVWLRSESDSYRSVAVQFDVSKKSELLKFHEDDIVVVSGEVKEFYAGVPWVVDCSISRIK